MPIAVEKNSTVMPMVDSQIYTVFWFMISVGGLPSKLCHLPYGLLISCYLDIFGFHIESDESDDVEIRNIRTIK